MNWPSSRDTVPSILIIGLIILHSGLEGVAQSEKPIRGFSASQVKEQVSWEKKMQAIPDPNSLREYMSVLAAEPHHLGSPKGKENAEWMLQKFEEWGLDASIEEYRVLFPTPTERHVELLAPEKYVARLQEPVLVEDKDSSDRNQLPTYNAYSVDGDVTAQIVYVNYGIPSDYETLRTQGVDVEGKIVLARYGAGWRGIKPKVAYENGAIGCLLYSDPKDDGYYVGLVYPEGPYRPEYGVQRGSVADMPIQPGDPLTPGIAATENADRLPLAQAKTLTKIPVMPISWGDALPILRNLRGPVAPTSWRGALPVTYHVGPGPALVHLKLSSSWDLHPLYNIIARIEGSTFPDEWIVQGNHHDAWVNGAMDPISGMITLLEEARALGELLRQGWRPKRTIVLAAWDGEEQGLFGSVEWAEQHAEELREKAVIYINSDSNSKGWLRAGGSHSLERFVHEVARDIPDPNTGKSVYYEARKRRLQLTSDEKTKKDIRERIDLRIGALGSGSDFTVFIDHLGIASLNLSFGDAGGSGVYHSIYDSFTWYTRFADTTFGYGRALAQLNGTAVMRLANAPILPFEFTNLADTIGNYIEELENLAKIEGGVDVTPLVKAQETLLKRAVAFERSYENATSSESSCNRSPTELAHINKLLYQSERILTSAEGLPRRTWFKHQLYAPGIYTGYGVKSVPYVREALEQKNWEEARNGVEVVRQRVEALARHIEKIELSIHGK